MRLLLPVFAVLTLLGCSSPGTPIAPDAPVAAPMPAATTDALWGMVIGPGGACVNDATVEVVRGQAEGQRSAQETPCDAWGYGGGFVFKGLSPGMEMTLRASAPGWSTEEMTVVPPGAQQQAVLITLKKL